MKRNIERPTPLRRRGKALPRPNLWAAAERAPRGQTEHQARPIRIKVKTTPGHQRIQVRALAKFFPARGEPKRPMYMM